MPKEIKEKEVITSENDVENIKNGAPENKKLKIDDDEKSKLEMNDLSMENIQNSIKTVLDENITLRQQVGKLSAELAAFKDLHKNCIPIKSTKYNKLSLRNSNLKSHIDAVHENKKFKYDPKKLDHWEKLLEHKSSVGKKPGKLFDESDKSFIIGGISNAKIHTNVHEGGKKAKKILNCDSCGKTFMHIRTLIRHKNYDHNNETKKQEKNIEAKTALTFFQNVKKTFLNQPQMYQDFLILLKKIKNDPTSLDAHDKAAVMIKDYPELTKELKIYFPFEYSKIEPKIEPLIEPKSEPNIETKIESKIEYQPQSINNLKMINHICEIKRKNPNFTSEEIQEKLLSSKSLGEFPTLSGINRILEKLNFGQELIQELKDDKCQECGLRMELKIHLVSCKFALSSNTESEN